MSTPMCPVRRHRGHIPEDLHGPVQGWGTRTTAGLPTVADAPHFGHGSLAAPAWPGV